MTDPIDKDRQALAEFIDKALDGDAGYGVGAFLAGGILGFLSDRAALHAAFRQDEPSDAALIDLWWETSNDVWAIPDELMVKFGRAARALRAAGAA